MIRNPYYVVQNQENEFLIKRKKELEGGFMDNILKINLFVFFICLIIVVLIFIFDTEIVQFRQNKGRSIINEYF